jgi:D-beta-D-heptose 7-phosphate kinase/D-beta-D-heptose 1-phosphate adenosyltransferase
MKIVLVTGGFDPLHSGHIAYFKAAKKLGDKLIVGLNSDEWLERKKGRAFMPWNERLAIVNNLKMVDETFTFLDDDGTAKNFINQVRAHYPEAHLIFANGGDRTADNIPEMDVVDANISFAFSVGGEDKKNSRSWILTEWKAPKTERTWGYYRVLHDIPGCKVKELTVNPGQSLSMQRHFKRHEFWHVTEGKCILKTSLPSGYSLPPLEMTTFSQVQIPQGDWHQLTNPFDEPCKIVEIQYGSACEESDIERSVNIK